MKRTWRIRYKGWIITHDPLGTLACYRDDGSPIVWCYFGCSVDVIKLMIDRREHTANLS